MSPCVPQLTSLRHVDYRPWESRDMMLFLSAVEMDFMMEYGRLRLVHFVIDHKTAYMTSL
jgi:hypothetical protein